MAAVITDYTPVVQQLYVSYFGRPADYYGLTAFENQLVSLNAPTSFDALNAAAQNGTNPGLTALINSFSTSQESINVYGTGIDQISISKFVNAIYNNVLNRDADVSGLTYWVNAITSGSLSKANAAAAITAGALVNTSAQGVIDHNTVVAKTAVAGEFTSSLTTTAEINGYAGDSAAATARDMLQTVTNTTDPIAFQSTINSTIGTITSDSGTPLVLSLGQDTLTGTSGDDVFNAGVVIDAGGGQHNSLQSFDILDGGNGNNTLNVTLVEDLEDATVSPLLKNIQTITIRSVISDGANANMDLSNTTGTTTVNVSNSTVQTFVSGVGSIASFGVTHQHQSVELGGNTSPTVALNLDTVSSSDGGLVGVEFDSNVISTLNVTANNASANVNAGGNALTTLTVAATGSDELYFNYTEDHSIKTVTVTGSGSLTFDDNFAALTKLDASANTGGVTAYVGSAAVTVTGGAGDDAIIFAQGSAIASNAKINLGAGDDTLTLNGISAVGAVVDGGTGTNTLVVTDLSFIDANAKAIYTNFEVLELSNNGENDGQTFDASTLAGITSYVLDTSESAIAITKLAAAPSVTVDGVLASLDLELKTQTGTTDTATVVLDNGISAAHAASHTGDHGVGVGNLVANVETLNLTSNGNIGATGSANFATVDSSATNNLLISKVVITGAAAIDFTFGVGEGTTSLTHNVTIDATAATGSVTVHAESTLDGLVNINGGSGADSIYGSVGGGAIYGGAAGDTITLNANPGADLNNSAAFDTLVYKAASDSVFSLKADGSLDLAKIDVVSGFVSGQDKIDLTSLNFTANTDKIVVQHAGVADLASLATLAATAGFYNDPSSIARGVVEVAVGSDTFVFIDANHDHKFDASTDLVIKLAATPTIVTGDIVFG